MSSPSKANPGPPAESNENDEALKVDMSVLEPVRPYSAGDNRLPVDIVVTAAPFVQALEAAVVFADPQDKSATYSHVRLTPHGDVLVITAGDMISRFMTVVPMVEPASGTDGVIDLHRWQAKKVKDDFAKLAPDEDLRVSAGMGQVRVTRDGGLFSESDGSFDEGEELTGRHRFHAAQAAPDIPQIIAVTFGQDLGVFPPCSLKVAGKVAKAAQILGADFTPRASDTTHLFLLTRGVTPVARVASAIPQELRGVDPMPAAPGTPQITDGSEVVRVSFLPPKGAL